MFFWPTDSPPIEYSDSDSQDGIDTSKVKRDIAPTETKEKKSR